MPRSAGAGSGQDLSRLPGGKKQEPPVLGEARPVTGAHSLLPSVLIKATGRTTDPPLHVRLKARPAGRRGPGGVRFGDCLQ